jgi:DNA-binding response OmpR family regulator
MRRTILVVDDDPQIRNVIAEALHDEGYRVRAAADGLKALREIAADPPDVVIADIRMPGLDGITLAERLARRSATPPVILMSADRPGLACAGRAFLAKPFQLDELSGAVARALTQPRRGAAHLAREAACRSPQYQRSL